MIIIGGFMKNKNKKIVLKKWLESVLIIINFIMFVIFASDMNDTNLFIISHVSALIVFMFNSFILYKYGRLIQE